MLELPTVNQVGGCFVYFPFLASLPLNGYRLELGKSFILQRVILEAGFCLLGYQIDQTFCVCQTLLRVLTEHCLPDVVWVSSGRLGN